MARPSSRSRRNTFFASVALALLAAAPLALGSQGEAKAKKKGPKAAPSASASAAPAEEPTPAPTPAPEPEPAPAPAASDTTTPPEAGTASAEDVGDPITNVREDPHYTYYYVGLRYRANLIPAFLEHLFVNDGFKGVLVSNSFGAEFEMRKAQASVIPWLQYTEYGFGDTLFFQKGVADTPNNYTIVNSQLKAIYAGVDLLWAVPIDKLEEHYAVDFGLSVGVGALFGNLYNNWAWSPDQTPGLMPQNFPQNTIAASNGHVYAKCNSETDGSGCARSDHQNASVAKVGNYVEPNWFNGGSVPVVFLHIGGQVGFRWKPIKQLQVRVVGGIQLTGFMLGASVDYGLPSSEPKRKDTNPSMPPAKENTPGSGSSSEKN
jgi:hypothetical protein